MKKTLFLAMSLFAVVAAACSSSGSETTAPPSGTGSPPPPTAPPGDQVTVTMKDFSFDPAVIVASTAQALVLTNSGTVQHDFSVEGTPIDQVVDAGQSVTLTAPGPSFAPGTYVVFCKFHRAQGMVAALTALPG